MKLVIAIENSNQLETLIAKKNDLSVEVILSTHLLSRYSKTTLPEMLELVLKARQNHFDVVLSWDVLNQEERFIKSCEVIDRLPLHDFSAILVQDPGALHYIKTKYPWLKIHLVLENGNHNLVGLQKWSDYLGEQCARLVISNELSKETLKEYADLIKTPIEVLVFGRILLFYSPRKLLSPEKKDVLENEFIEAFGTSEESPHSGFPLIENEHGTFMFNVKDLYLLDHLADIEEMGVNHSRVDLRFDDSFNRYSEDIFDLFLKRKMESELSIKKNHPRPLIKGFYNINKTDVLFSKLKNKRIERNDFNYIGEIVDVERDCQLALLIKTNAIQMDTATEIKMVTPEGKEKYVQITWMKSSLGENLKMAQKNDLVLIPYTSGVTVKTQVYLNPKT